MTELKKEVANATQVKSEKKGVLFFVYGTLKEGYGNHAYCLKGAQSLGKHVTEPKYTLYNGGFPVAERGGKTAVSGELYYTENPNQIKATFGLEGCASQEQGHPNNWYDIDYIETPHGKAVFFVMNEGQSGRGEVLENGIWK